MKILKHILYGILAIFGPLVLGFCCALFYKLYGGNPAVVDQTIIPAIMSIIPLSLIYIKILNKFD